MIEFKLKRKSGYGRKQINFRIPDDLYEKLADIADANNLTISETARCMIFHCLTETTETTRKSKSVSYHDLP